MPVVCGYRAYKKPRWKWLEKLMRRCRLLVDDHDPIMMDTFETFDICDKDVERVLRAGMHEIMLGRPHKRPSRVYIGQEYFDDLCRDLSMKICEPIKMPFRIYGTEIVVTPYLDTFLPVWEGTDV